MKNRWVVETDWLAQHLDAPDVVIVDGSWHMPGEARDAAAEYRAERIPGAVFLDIDDISDTASALPHMLPDAVKFASRMRKLGIGDGMRIVVYDTRGLFSAARVWWMLRVMGVDDVAVLNGGLPKWRSEERELDVLVPAPRAPRHFTVRRRADLVRSCEQVLALQARAPQRIVDARPAGRFAGRDAEPRAGLRKGHIPGSHNVPFASLIDGNGCLKAASDIRAVFAEAGVDVEQNLVTTCGSGVTAAILSLALAVVGKGRHALYDGSWAEWGASDTLPIAPESGPMAPAPGPIAPEPG